MNADFLLTIKMKRLKKIKEIYFLVPCTGMEMETSISDFG